MNTLFREKKDCILNLIRPFVSALKFKMIKCYLNNERVNSFQGLSKVMKNFPQEIKKFEIETFERPKNLKELRRTHVPFSGSPLKHPLDPKKVILIPDPYTTSPFYYEFKSDDIGFAERLPNVVNLKGETITMVRFWVKKMSVGTLCTPFIVEETTL